MKANKSKQYKILSPYEQQVFTLRVDKQDRQKKTVDDVNRQQKTRISTTTTEKLESRLF